MSTQPRTDLVQAWVLVASHHGSGEAEAQERTNIVWTLAAPLRGGTKPTTCESVGARGSSMGMTPVNPFHGGVEAATCDGVGHMCLDMGSSYDSSLWGCVAGDSFLLGRCDSLQWRRSDLAPL